jgi:hypothetical protein
MFFWIFCIYHCMQDIEKKTNLNILQLVDMLVSSFISITTSSCFCPHNFIVVVGEKIPVKGIFLLLMLSFI